MIAKSQEFNDNTCENTDLCFDCLLYKTNEDFEFRGKKICSGCEKELNELAKKKGVIFIEKERNEPSYSGWYQGLTDHTDVYAIVGNREIFLKGYVQEKGHDTETGKADIFKLKRQFLLSNFNYICFYNSGESKDPLKFIKNIKKIEDNFGDNYNCELRKKEGEEFYYFHGNLERVSCAFSFRIFNKEYYEEIVETLKDPYFKNIKIGEKNGTRK